eukprot:g3094.t1
MAKVADYVALVEATANAGVGDSEKTKLDISVTHRWPEHDRQGRPPFPKQVLPLFCFPQGKVMMAAGRSTEQSNHRRSIAAEDEQSWKNMLRAQPSSFAFVLTDTDGSQRHVSCLSFHRVSAENGQHSRAVLCIIAELPLYGLLEAVLVDALRGISLVGKAYMIHTPEAFLKAVLTQRAPDPTLVLPSSCGKRVFYRRRNDNAMLPFVDDAVFGVLFRCISADMLPFIIEALLLERRILFHSRHPHRLTGVISAVLALIYPFSWPHVFIPILPHELVHYLQAPMPYCIGILSSAFRTTGWQEMELEQRPQVVVHIDDNIVEADPPWRQRVRQIRHAEAGPGTAPPPPPPRLPKPIRDWLIESTFAAVPSHSGHDDAQDDDSNQDVANDGSRKEKYGVRWRSNFTRLEWHLPDAKGRLTEPKRDVGDPFVGLSGSRNGQWIDAVRLNFFSAVVALLVHVPSRNDFRSFLGTKSWKQKFIARGPESGSGFVSCLVQTQSFQQLVDLMARSNDNAVADAIKYVVADRWTQCDDATQEGQEMRTAQSAHPSVIKPRPEKRLKAFLAPDLSAEFVKQHVRNVDATGRRKVADKDKEERRDKLQVKSIITIPNQCLWCSAAAKAQTANASAELICKIHDYGYAEDWSQLERICKGPRYRFKVGQAVADDGDGNDSKAWQKGLYNAAEIFLTTAQPVLGSIAFRSCKETLEHAAEKSTPSTPSIHGLNEHKLAKLL